MSSAVDICNLALSYLGDTATVASIDPPEGSAQSEHCARFFPIARDALLAMHPWSFATRREPLALLDVTNDQWDYVYAAPNLLSSVLAVIASDAADDYTSTAVPETGDTSPPLTAYGAYTPQPYARETLSDGSQVILTNQEDAVIRYVAKVTDPGQFDALFVICLSWRLAAMLAGPLIKNEAGAAESKRCLAMFLAELKAARENDANQRQVKPFQVVPWMAGR